MIIKANDLYAPWANSPKLPNNFAVSDPTYFCPTEDMVMKEIFPKYWKWLGSMRLTKWYHRWDCDNFADAFKLFACGYYFNIIESEARGIAIGTMWYNANQRAEDGIKGGHAINIIYVDDGKNDDGTDAFRPMFLEPQNSKIYQLSQEEFDSIWMVYI